MIPAIQIIKYIVIFATIIIDTLSLSLICLTLKVPITTAAEDINKYFFIVFLEKKNRLVVQVNPLLSRGFTWKIKPYFFFKDKSKKLKCRLLQFLFGALRVNLLCMFETECMDVVGIRIVTDPYLFVSVTCHDISVIFG